ncbi:MAG: ABC transporter permease [Chloroflexi bacterium]|nr:ABC transporter permease [Chloroflexota bacterium]
MTVTHLERRGSTPLERLQLLLHRRPTISPLVVLIVASAVFGLASDRFLQPSNLSLILQQVAVIALLAVGQTIIVLTAGIDLSVGAMMILVALVMGAFGGPLGWNGIVVVLLGLMLGGLAGGLNAFLVVRIRLPPFIATLGTLNIFVALALILSGGRSTPGTDLDPFLTWTATAFAIGDFRLTMGVVLVLLVYLVVGFALSQTAWGRHIYATGDDEPAAHLTGIRTRRVLTSAYVLAGVICGLAAWALIGRVGAATPNSAVDANLDSITAVVIGGTSLFGGRGRLAGTLLGALIVGVFRNGLALMRVDVIYQTLAIGVLILLAVSLDQWIRKGRSAS